MAEAPGAAPAGADGTLLPAAFAPALLAQGAVPVGSVEITFLDHASFLIRSPGGATAITDYNGIERAPAAPDIVTMNNAHSTHYTDTVEPGVKYVLRGWDPGGGVPVHDLFQLDMHVRNVPTNLRDVGGTRIAGNSIFVFEVAGLCIAHLGHLHHLLEPMHLDELGPIDVLMVPADGTYALSQELMARVVDQIRPAVVIPMHYFSQERLARFLGFIADDYPPEWLDGPTIVLSRALLSPRRSVVSPER
ncbi:MAG: MBL fold metallo-hydrolase [Rhodospirillaceae bacterium]|nr:MBL fold metallo-hydrolase [Rhodospirillaceae bacterium]